MLTVVLSGPWASAQVVINEVCAENGSTLSPGGTVPDYVELYNTSVAPADLTGWSLTDDAAAPLKFQFPAGTTVPARGYLVVWLDSVTNYAGLIATNFSLRASGEAVALYFGLALQDYIPFGPQIKDKVLGRAPDGSQNWTLGPPSPGYANTALALGTPLALRINELLATNFLGNDWLELHNPPTNPPVAIGLLVFAQTNASTNLPPALWPNSFIDADGFIQFQCNGSTNRGDYLNFKLSSTLGQVVNLFASNRTTLIDSVAFGPQTRDVSYGRLPDAGTNFYYFQPGHLTPGAPNDWLPLTNVVINEVLTHTDPPLEDAIELWNVTDQPVDISYWWLSNSRNLPFKFRIPAGTVIPAQGFKVFFEQVGSTTPGFNRSGTDTAPDFTLNAAHGDEVVLTAGTATNLITGARSVRDLPAAANGVSMIRHVKSSGTDMAPAGRRTFGQDAPSTLAQFRLSGGASNVYPLVGPIVICEIMYHPPDVIVGGLTNDNTLDEYIELMSITNVAVPLYDPAYPTNTWELKGGMSYQFPMNTTVAPGESLLLVNFDPATNLIQVAAFRARYNVNAAVRLFGPYGGKLKNSTDSVELYRPDAVQLPPRPDAGYVPSLLVEKVKYDQTNGWPADPDGLGFALHRLSLRGYANDPTNWFATIPAPGVVASPGNPPVIATAPASQTVLAGGTATFTVAVTGDAPFGYQWHFNDAPLPGAVGSSVSVPNVQWSNAGPYRVAVSNAFGIVTSPAATLIVGQPPIILASPGDVSVPPSSNVVLKVVCVGPGPLYYQWLFQGNALPGATRDTLTLSNIQAAQAGDYEVLVANEYGLVISDRATVAVGVAPSVTTISSDQFAVVGTTVSLGVTATGTAPLSYQWRRNGLALPGETGATVTLNNATTNQSGAYDVLVSNALGAIASPTVQVSIAGPPWLQPLMLSNSLPRVTLMGLPGHIYEIEGSTDLIHWSTISRFTNVSGPQIVPDAAGTNAPYRFYRGRLVQ